MSANFDNSAWFYDRLSRLVYGKALIKSQVYLLQFIPAASNVLIVGGGTGWILDELTRLYPSGLNITYVEVSAKMIARAKKRNTGANKVSFIHNGVEEIVALPAFDVVLTPFLFDNFTEETLLLVFEKVSQALKTGGLWLNADFRPAGIWWHHVLLKAMFLFFRLVCNIEAFKLPDIDSRFIHAGLQLLHREKFFRKFIVAEVYGKSK